ncbi:hypothetical protein L841_3371 [Mycobacterium sp. MAC_080597_8934]|nr:hypothetical protein L841_3371 [Mycobacterium sp. MAC_080597_8934]ETZ66766.1 hypothetical protein L840_1841 [Mycobacterium sp. MAC_011194_8550]
MCGWWLNQAGCHRGGLGTSHTSRVTRIRRCYALPPAPVSRLPATCQPPARRRRPPAPATNGQNPCRTPFPR